MLRRMEFTLQIGCKLNCRYCPQALLLKRYKSNIRSLSFEQFQKACSKIAPGGWTIFNGMSEPFLNKDCIKMLHYANDKGYHISMASTLVGLKGCEVESLRDIRFSGFFLHIPDKENNSRFDINEEYLDVLEWVCKNIKITGYSCHGAIHPLVNKYISRDIPLYNKMGDRAGNLKYSDNLGGLPYSDDYLQQGMKQNLYSSAIRKNLICTMGKSRTGWIPEMLPDGRLVLCCNDYGMRHILGNIIEQDWDDIVQGEEYRKIFQITGDYGKLCQTCDAAIPIEELELFTNSSILWPLALEIQNQIREGMAKNGILRKLKNAKICIWGLGKFFWEDFFANGWETFLNPMYYTDSNISDQHTQKLKNIISIEDALSLKDVLYIIYTKETREIEEILKSENKEYVKVLDIYRALIE